MKLTLRHLMALCTVTALGYLAGWVSSRHIPPPSFSSASSPIFDSKRQNNSTAADLPTGYFLLEEEPTNEKTRAKPPIQPQQAMEEITSTSTSTPQERNDLRGSVLVGNTERVRELLQQDIWIAPDIWTNAIQLGNIEILELLLEKQPDSVNQNFAIAIAQNSRPAVLQLLLDKGAELEAKTDFGETPLLQAAGQGNFSAVQFLLEKGADVTKQDDTGRTSLMLAAEAEPLQTATNQGSENSTEKYTALHTQLQQQYQNIIQFLLRYRASINARDNQGFTALMWATLSGNTSLAEVLLQNKAEVNLKAKDGRTALSMAVEERHPETVQLLLAHGADVDIKVPFYQEETKQTIKMRPLAYARFMQYTDIVTMLEKAGAKE